MKPIVTVTLNPCIDGASDTDEVSRARLPQELQSTHETFSADGERRCLACTSGRMVTVDILRPDTS